MCKLQITRRLIKYHNFISEYSYFTTVQIFSSLSITDILSDDFQNNLKAKFNKPEQTLDINL